MLRNLTSRFISFVRGAKTNLKEYPVHLPAPRSLRCGNALCSYIGRSLLWENSHPQFLTHSAFWESREIALILNKMGYDVDAVEWNDNSFIPAKNYDVILDIDANLQRWAPLMPENTVRILHLTGSYGPYQHQAELARVADFEDRTGKLYSPKRLVRWVELAERSLRLAHHCSLIGNGITLATYPEIYQNKISLVPVSGSILNRVRSSQEMVPEAKEFLWFFGGGAVHKGLDLVLEVFACHPELTLHIVGKVEAEYDFVLAYKNHLAMKNIHMHGHLAPGEPQFADLLKNVFCFIAPSCSEGISPAVVTCLQFGLYPIISHQTGVTLPPACGIYLDELSSQAIDKAVADVLAIKKFDLCRQIQECQKMALAAYSRKSFSLAYTDFLANVLNRG